MAETDLQQAQRHVREGEARITRQRALIKKLRDGGHDKLADEAEHLLSQFVSIQNENERHVKRIAPQE